MAALEVREKRRVARTIPSDRVNILRSIVLSFLRCESSRRGAGVAVHGGIGRGVGARVQGEGQQQAAQDGERAQGGLASLAQALPNRHGSLLEVEVAPPTCLAGGDAATGTG